MSNNHWCQEHEVEFFKRGQMKGYAHTIGDTGKWCNEPEGGSDPMPEHKEVDKALKEATEELKKPDPKSSGKNRSFALAYIKDIVVALINARTIEKITPAIYAEMLERAESWAKWLDG